jgi:hypothetical protein
MTRITERQALEVCMLRSLEQSAGHRAIWTADDAKEATREARDLVSKRGSYTDFLARRARWALERLAERSPDRVIVLRNLRWGAAFTLCFLLTGLLGLLADHLTTRMSVGFIETGLLALIAWNVIFMAYDLLKLALGVFARQSRRASPIGELLSSLYFRFTVQAPHKSLRHWMSGCQFDWSRLASGLNRYRLSMVLHSLAIAFALGVVLSLHVTATRDFLIPAVLAGTIDVRPALQQLYSWFMAPGASLFGLSVPSMVAAPVPQARDDIQGLARQIIDLHAASLVAWVILPRLILLLANVWNVWRLSVNFPLPMKSAYFSALRAIWKNEAVAVLVIPVRNEMSSVEEASLRSISERTYGLGVEVSFAKSLQIGDDPAELTKLLRKRNYVAVVPVFNIVATAEEDTHGALLRSIASAGVTQSPIVPIVDVSALPAGNEERLRSRQRQWKQVLEAARLRPLFINLARSLEADVAQFQSRLERDA